MMRSDRPVSERPRSTFDRQVRLCPTCGSFGYRHDRYCAACGDRYPVATDDRPQLPLHHDPLYCPCCGRRTVPTE